MLAGAANLSHAAHTRRVSAAGLALLQAKLPRNSSQIARGRIRRFESYMPNQAVGSLGRSQRQASPLVRIPHFSEVEAENPLRLLNTAIASMRPAYAAVFPIKSSDGESNLTFETGS